MPLTIAPTSALAPTKPAVGIFWWVNGALVIDRSTLGEAEPYGDCLTHAAGHYERWQEWQALGPARLAGKGFPAEIAWTEYDDWPRGRVVYKKPRSISCFMQIGARSESSQDSQTFERHIEMR